MSRLITRVSFAVLATTLGCAVPAKVRVEAPGTPSVTAQMRHGATVVTSCTVPCVLEYPKGTTTADLALTAPSYFPALVTLNELMIRNTAVVQGGEDATATLRVPMERRPDKGHAEPPAY